MKIQNPVICAIDVKDVAQAEHLCCEIASHIGMVKLGLEFFLANGIDGVKRIEALGLPIFLDLKLHDIPNTVAKAIASLESLNIALLTIHTQGGKDMMQRAKEAAGEKVKVVGVTILTSLDDQDIAALGYHTSASDQALHLAELAKDSGLDGVVCSPYEIKPIKQACGDAFITVVPGIRPQGSAQNDQKRSLAPKDALEQGADYLVIGRPITQANEPAKVTQEILSSLTS